MSEGVGREYEMVQGVSVSAEQSGREEKKEDRNFEDRYYACGLLPQWAAVGTLLFHHSRLPPMEETTHDHDSDPQRP